MIAAWPVCCCKVRGRVGLRTEVGVLGLQPGALEHLGADADLAEGLVGEALADGVRPEVQDEVALERLDVRGVALLQHRELTLEIGHQLGGEQLLDGIRDALLQLLGGLLQRGLDGLQGPLASALGLVLLQRVQVGLDGPGLDAAGSQGGLVLVAEHTAGCLAVAAAVDGDSGSILKVEAHFVTLLSTR